MKSIKQDAFARAVARRLSWMDNQEGIARLLRAHHRKIVRLVRRMKLTKGTPNEIEVAIGYNMACTDILAALTKLSR